LIVAAFYSAGTGGKKAPERQPFNPKWLFPLEQSSPATWATVRQTDGQPGPS
jgi:hypothetical protein